MFRLGNQSARELADSAYTLRRGMSGLDTRAPTREDVAETGLAIWPLTYKHAEGDDRHAFESLMRWTEEKGGPVLQASILIPSEQISLLGAARWVDQAFPRFIMSHTYAAALMATSVSEEVLDHVRAPYHAFMIDVPDGLLSTIDSATGKEAKIKFLLVHHVNGTDGRPWQYIAYTDSPIHMWRHGVSTKDLCEAELPNNSWEGCSFIAPKDDRDDRVSALIGRLIVGVCLAALEPSNLRPTSGHTTKTNPEQLRPSDIRTFKLGRPIKLDCRRSIGEYVTGRRSGLPSVRTLVRGHWKEQPHGPKSSLRKVIWRQPYERGPADAPILVRPTVMGGDGGPQAGT